MSSCTDEQCNPSSQERFPNRHSSKVPIYWLDIISFFSCLSLILFLLSRS